MKQILFLNLLKEEKVYFLTCLSRVPQNYIREQSTAEHIVSFPKIPQKLLSNVSP